MGTEGVSFRSLSLQPTLTIPARVALREIGTTISTLLPAVFADAQARGAKVTGPPFVRYLSMGETIELEAGVPIAKPVLGTGRAAAGELPPGEALVGVHLGPYETIGETYGKIDAFASAHGRTLAPTMWEVYCTDPSSEPDPSKWRTEVVCPLT